MACLMMTFFYENSAPVSWILSSYNEVSLLLTLSRIQYNAYSTSCLGTLPQVWDQRGLMKATEYRFKCYYCSADLIRWECLLVKHERLLIWWLSLNLLLSACQHCLFSHQAGAAERNGFYSWLYTLPRKKQTKPVRGAQTSILVPEPKNTDKWTWTTWWGKTAVRCWGRQLVTRCNMRVNAPTQWEALITISK